MRMAIKNYNEEQLQKRAVEIIKYQNYKTNIAIEKMSIKIPRGTIDAAVTYLKRGIANPPLTKGLKAALDKAKEQYIQPLRPAIGEERKFKIPPYQGKEANPPIVQMPLVHKKLTCEIDYGVLINDCIKLFNSEKEASIFLEGIKFMNGQGILVEVEKRPI